MIEGVGLTTGMAASLSDAWQRETARKDEQADPAVCQDTATISQGAGQRLSWEETSDMTAGEADEALAFVQDALAGQGFSGLHELSADRVMQLVGLLG